MIIPSYFKTSFNKDTRERLKLEDFWINEKPCHWTLLHYLEVLLKQDPAISRRSASHFLLADSKIIKENVVAGTVADTKVNAMRTYTQNTRAKKAFSTFFTESADTMSNSIINYRTQKYRLRSSMAEQVADKEESTTKKKGFNNHREEGSSSRKKIKTTISTDEEYDEHGEEESEESIWVKWKQFLDDPINTQHLMQLSPEKHGIIWYGRLLRRRSCLPYDLYSKLNDEVFCIEAMYIDPCFLDEVTKIVEQYTSRDDMAVKIKKLDEIPAQVQSLLAEKKLLTDILNNFQREIYDNCGMEVLSRSEMCYRSYIFDNCIKSCTQYLRNKGYNITFIPGEIELQAMTTQLKNKGMTDGRYKYNADGLVCANDFANLEILLTEVSSGYCSAEDNKVSFDHYKAMFGMLSMIRTIAQTYSKGTLNTFKKLKVHFLHGHGDAVRHWTLSMQEVGVFLMNKEQRATVPVDFKEKDISMISFLEFYLTFAAGCEVSLSVLKQLKEEHKMALKNRNQESGSNLLRFVNPSIIRLNEGKHMGIVAEEGPMSVPNSPLLML